MAFFPKSPFDCVFSDEPVAGKFPGLYPKKIFGLRREKNTPLEPYFLGSFCDAFMLSVGRSPLAPWSMSL
jgi:hypothetical protein